MKTSTKTFTKACGILFIVVMSSICSMGQSACRSAAPTTTERFENYTLYTVSLPVNEASIFAKAFIPAKGQETSATVFSLSTLIATEPDRKIDMMPVAIELAKSGRAAAIVIDRTLTWPEISNSVGAMQTAVLCAQQWIAAHTTIKKAGWLFVGPKPDEPTFEQLRAAGDNGTMSFAWGFPLGGPNEDINTDGVLRRGMLTAEQLTGNIVDF